MMRSILAVVVGSVVWMVTALGTDVLLHRLAPGWFDAKFGHNRMQPVHDWFFEAIGAGEEKRGGAE